MECSKILDLLSSAVDNQLKDDEAKLLEKHIKTCVRCKKELELERVTKNVVRANLYSYNLPEEIRNKIILQIEKCSSISGKLFLFLTNIDKKYRPIAYSLPVLILLLLAYIISTDQGHKHNVSYAANNFIAIAYNQFDEVLGKEYYQVSQMTPLSVDKNISKYFIPKLKRCSIVDFWTSNAYGEEIINIVYQSEEHIIYCSEINFESVSKNKNIVLDEKILRELMEKGKYLTEDFSCCSMLLWLYKGNLCALVAEMENENLLKYLQDFNYEN